MAYTNTPDENTYRTVRLPLAGTAQQRQGSYSYETKDQRLVNIYAEPYQDPDGDKGYKLRSRPGVAWVMDLKPGSTGAGRGVAYFNGYYYAAIDGQLYQNTMPVATLGTTSGNVGFVEFNGTYNALIVLDGIKGWVVKTDGSVTQITDPDFPSPHIPAPVYLDGYVFVAKSGTADIYNSDLEDPFSWTPGNFITAESNPDNIVMISRYNNYIAAIGSKTVEFFYDAAVPTGSPLARNTSAIQTIGCPAPYSVVRTNTELIMVGDTGGGGRTVWLFNGFTPKQIGSVQVNECLDEEMVPTDILAYWISSGGHRFYVLTVSARTWVYDFDSGLWHEWSSPVDDTVAFTTIRYVCEHPDGKPKGLSWGNATILEFRSTSGVDSTTQFTAGDKPITCFITTDKKDFGSNNRKFMSRLALIGDVPVNDGSNVPVTIQWSDDDYNTWSDARTLQLNSNMGAITQCGMFRRRAFKFKITAGKPIRIDALEVDLNIGRN